MPSICWMMTNSVVQEPEGSSPHSQQLTTRPSWASLIQFTRSQPISEIHSPIYALVSFLRAFQLKPCTLLSPEHATLNDNLINHQKAAYYAGIKYSLLFHWRLNFFLVSWVVTQYLPLKCWYLTTSPCSVTTHKTNKINFTAVTPKVSLKV
jgi:hypothetical protein